MKIPTKLHVWTNMAMMALIDTSLEGIKFQYQTDFLTRSPTHHATRRCSLHPDHLAHPRLSVFHRTAATTTTARSARTTTPVFLPTMQTATTTTTTTPRSTSLSPRSLTLHTLVMTTPLTSEEPHSDVDEPTDDMDAAMVEALHQVEDEATAIRNGPEMVNIW